MMMESPMEMNFQVERIRLIQIQMMMESPMETNLLVALILLDSDSDDDGISDGDELSGGTDPIDSDSDDDGITDGKTIPKHPDVDNDGVLDGIDPDNTT